MTVSPLSETEAEAGTRARIDPLWWSWGGAHGGHAAAVALSAVRDRFPGGAHPVRSLTTYFLGPVGTGPLHLSGAAPSNGRRAATCVFTAEQDGKPVLAGSALFGPGRPGPAYDGTRAPAVPGPHDCPVREFVAGQPPFIRQLEMRPATEARSLGGGEKAELVSWVRFLDGRALDAGAVVTLTDVLPPGLFACWRTPRPVPSAELTVHFTDALDDDGPDGDAREGWALVRIRTEQAGGGWAVDDSAVWAADGRLLAVGRQARVVQEPSRAPAG